MKSEKIINQLETADTLKFRLEDVTQETKQLGIEVDELEHNCQQGIKKSGRDFADY